MKQIIVLGIPRWKKVTQDCRIRVIVCVWIKREWLGQNTTFRCHKMYLPSLLLMLRLVNVSGGCYQLKRLWECTTNVTNIPLIGIFLVLCMSRTMHIRWEKNQMDEKERETEGKREDQLTMGISHESENLLFSSWREKFPFLFVVLEKRDSGGVKFFHYNIFFLFSWMYLMQEWILWGSQTRLTFIPISFLVMFVL